MKSGWTFCVFALVLLTSIASSSGRSEDPPSSKTITVCQIEYTTAGRQSSWRVNYSYIVNTNQDGSVVEVRRLEKEKRSLFVNEERILECMKTWKLSPSGKHVVLFSIGTSGGGNSISVVDPNRNSIRLLL